MAGALPNIGYHISEKELIRENMWVFFILEPTRLLGACKPGLRARMDSRTVGTIKKKSLYEKVALLTTWSAP